MGATTGSTERASREINKIDPARMVKARNVLARPGQIEVYKQEKTIEVVKGLIQEKLEQDASKGGSEPQSEDEESSQEDQEQGPRKDVPPVKRSKTSDDNRASSSREKPGS